MVESILRKKPYNCIYPKGEFSCSSDSLVVAESFVLRMNFCAEKPDNL